MAVPLKKAGKKKGIPPQMQRGISKKNVGFSMRNVAQGKGKGKQVKSPGKSKGGQGKAPKKPVKGGKAITSKAAPGVMKRTTTKKDISFQQMTGGGGKRASAFYRPGAGGRAGVMGKVGGPGGHKGHHSKQGSKVLTRSQPSRTQVWSNSKEQRGSVLHLFNSGKNKKKKSKK